ncbi:MAG: alpha/beta hydrolase [Bacteroidota bacterium]
MKLKKRHWFLIIFLAIILILAAVSRLEYFAMRTPDADVAQKLKDKGVENATFHDDEFEGKSVHYVHVGDPHKPLVMLVHGTPGSIGMFTRYLTDPTLLEVAQVVAVDRLGLGYSNFGVTERSVETHAAALMPIIERHAAPQVLILGHSYGGPVVARMAMDYPDQIDHLFMVAGSVSPELEPREWWRHPLDWSLVRWIIPPALRVANQEIMALYDELMRMKPLWSQIDGKVTIFQGTADKLVPAGNADFAAEQLSHLEQVEVNYVEGGDHFILWSKMDEIVARIAQNLRPDSTGVE